MAGDTANQLLDAAQPLVQRRGYNAFSYKDLAAEVGIRTASIHYHFPAKADLAKALMARYLESLRSALADIELGSSSVMDRLGAFIELYRRTESSGAICLCGSLASDRETLPEPVQGVVEDYLELSEGWVADQIAEGVRTGELDFPGDPADAAASLLSGLQGGLILSRARPGCPHLDTVSRMFFRSLGVSGSDPARV
ncbi:MAG: TetR/AcrR family transcriptional regulator [Acidobacteriota bacterium]